MLITASISANSNADKKKWKSEWQTGKTEDGITSECRMHTSGIKQCKLVVLTNLSVDSLVAVNIDGPNLKNWMANVMASETVEPASEMNYYMYMTYHFPGARNRDSVTHSIVTKDSKSNSVTLKYGSEKNAAKPKDLRFVRFPAIKGEWVFTQLPNGKTKVEYTNIALPGEYVQKVLAIFYNMSSLNSAFETMRNLLVEAKKPKYLNARLNYNEI